MTEKTVFIIGAGASSEAKLPTGNDLKKRIASLLNIHIKDNEPYPETLIIKAFKFLDQYDYKDGYSFLRDAKLIREALPLAISIDNFLQSHRKNKNITALGKLAIVKSILEAENASLLNFNRSNKDLFTFFSLIENTWYSSFFKLIIENCDVEDLKERLNTITLIIFNYDRCVEHFLFTAIKTYYNITDADAAKLMEYLTIFHPYGTVGELPWKKLGLKSETTIDFGGVPDYRKLAFLSTQIKTFTESSILSYKTLYNLHYKITDASRIVFLGFAFHSLNMQLLTPQNYNDLISEKTKLCYATAHNISQSDTEDIKRQIILLGPNPHAINLTNLECKDFFNHFWRSLSFKYNQ